MKSEGNSFSGHFEGNLFLRRFVFDGINTQTSTGKAGVRCHNFITSLFVNRWGSGTIKIQTNTGVTYLNKGSIKNLLAGANNLPKDSNDNGVLRQTLENLLQPPKGGLQQHHEGIEEQVELQEELIDIEPFKQPSDTEIAGSINTLLQERPIHYLNEVALAFEQIREPFDHIAFFDDLLHESASEEELFTAISIVNQLKKRLNQEKSLLNATENPSEEEVSFIKQTRVKVMDWTELIEELEIKFNIPLYKYLFSNTDEPYHRLDKVMTNATWLIHRNRFSHLFYLFQKYSNTPKSSDTKASWKECLKFLYEYILQRDKDIQMIKSISQYKQRFEQIRDVIAPGTEIGW